MRINKEAIPTMIICAIAIVIAIPISMYITSLLEGKKYYTATFLDLDGVYQTQENIEKNGRIIEPMAPYKDGYEFLGWYNDDIQYDFSTPVTSDLYIKAKWLNNETNTIEQMDNSVEQEIKKNTNKNSNNNNNSNGNNNSNNNGNNGNNNGNSGNNNGNTNPTPTSVPTPTPEPTPVPTPKVVPPSKPTTKQYTVTVNGGNGSNTYAEGSQITINAIAPASTSKVVGNTSCNSESDIGNYKYNEVTDYVFDSWNDGNKNPERTITVTGNVTYTANFKPVTRKEGAQKCERVYDYTYGYPTSFNIEIKNTAWDHSATGSFSAKTFYVCYTKCNMSSYFATSVEERLYETTFKASSTGTEWTMTYNRTNGEVKLEGGKKTNSRTVTLNISYSKNEDPEIVYCSSGDNACKSDPRYYNPYEKTTATGTQTSTEPISISFNLPKVKLKKVTKYQFQNSQ